MNLRFRPLAFVAVAAALAVSCAKNDDETVLDPVVVAMSETTPPIYDDGEVQIFQVLRNVPLPFRRFSDAERPQGQLAPYPRPPFHVATASRITVRFTITNLDVNRHNVELLVDPWNEFVRYEPGVSVVREDEVQPNFSGIQRSFVLEPRSRVTGIITPDDMVELATDLTTAMALGANPPSAEGQFGGAVLFNRAFNVQNRSSEPDIVLAPYLPGNKAFVAGVTGFTLGLRSEAAFRVAVEVVTDLEDKSKELNRIVISDDDGEEIDADPTRRVLGRPGNVLSPPAGGPD